LRKSLATVAGDLSANAVQMTLAAFGLTAIVAANANALWAVKWAGVAYLVWIGVQLILARDTQSGETPSPSGSAFHLFRMGFVTSLANPFAVVFFGALFPQFIDPSSPVLPQLLILGVTYLVVDGVLLVFWGWLGIRAASALKRHSLGLINKICGGLMIAAALLLASKDLEPRT